MATRILGQREATIRRLIAETIRAVEPDAEIILYGSRARGDALADSDWDVLVLVDGEVNGTREDRLLRSILDLEIDQGIVVSALLYSRRRWDSSQFRAMPFNQNVRREGMPCA